jgi:hypothetical protein
VGDQYVQQKMAQYIKSQRLGERWQVK